METVVKVRKNTDGSVYELVMDGAVAGRAVYREEGDTVVFPSVVVDRSLRGKGLGEQLTRYALDDAIASGKSVQPVCPFVVAFVRRHPEYQAHVSGQAYRPSQGDACEI